MGIIVGSMIYLLVQSFCCCPHTHLRVGSTETLGRVSQNRHALFPNMSVCVHCKCPVQIYIRSTYI